MQKKSYKLSLRTGASLLVLTGCAVLLAAPSGARAQIAPVAQPTDGLEEVIVTSQRRTQNLQDVPISVDTFSADFIQETGSQNMGDLQQFTPGLSVGDNSATQPTYSIRGITGSSFGIGTEPSVGIYIDGVYSARSGEALVFFDDLDRVEVLKGPQGTLFGRNTSAGAISVTTNKPSDHYEGLVDVKLGNYDKREISAVVNIPLTDTLDLRVDGIINRRDGDLKNLYGGTDVDNEHNEDARVALRWRPDADTDVNLYWDHDDTNQTPTTEIGVGPYAQYTGNPLTSVYEDEINGRETRKLNAVTLNIQRKFGGITFTSLSSYHQFDTLNRETETGTTTPDRYFDTTNIEDNHNYYQEFRINGTTGPFTYLAGASYYQERAKQQSIGTALTNTIDTLAAEAGALPIFEIGAENGIPDLGLPWVEQMNNLGQNRAESLFGDATYAATSQLDLTAGLRFTKDYKQFEWYGPPVTVVGGNAIPVPAALGGAAAALLGLPSVPTNVEQLAQDIGNQYIATAPWPQGVPFSRSESWANLSPRFVTSYKWTPDLMTYASASWGYKAGGFNSVEVNQIVQPEHVESFEIGMKSDWFDHKLRVNGSAYYYIYTNQQGLALQSTGTAVPQYEVQNNNSDAKGVDLEVHAVPVRDLTLSLVSGYIDSQWTRNNYEVNGSANQIVSLAGQPTGEPLLRAVIGADYKHDMDQLGLLRFHVDHSFTSASRDNSATRLTMAQLAALGVNYNAIPGYHTSQDLTNARLSWFSPSGNLELALYGQNIFDHHYYSAPGGETATALDTATIDPANPPRFYGAEAVYRF